MPLQCFTEVAVSEDYKRRWTSLYQEYLRESSKLCKLEDKAERNINFHELYQEYKWVSILLPNGRHLKFKGCPKSRQVFFFLRDSADAVQGRGVWVQPEGALRSLQRGLRGVPGGVWACDVLQPGQQVRLRLEGGRPRAVPAVHAEAQRWHRALLLLRSWGCFQEEPPHVAPSALRSWNAFCVSIWWWSSTL